MSHDSGYVNAVMSEKPDSVLRRNLKLKGRLQDRSPQALWTIIYYCCQGALSHWLRHVVPSLITPHGQRVDESILDLAVAASGTYVRDDEWIHASARLPVRLKGGLRSMVDVAPSAFAACISDVSPALIDRALSDAQNSNFVSGYSQGRLDDLYGTGAFDGPTRVWTAYFASSSPYAAEFKEALITMRLELGIARDDSGNSDLVGPLTNNSLYGFGSDNEIESYSLQASVTRQREHFRSAQYAELIAAELPACDYRRMAYEARGKVAALLLTSWPSGRDALPNRIWLQAISRFFGAPSPACER